ncbi:uncharacterized protein LOC132268320 isoform X2 [Cornus florida]|uniref:uncharacterized protein LOC132268320 isoform X2 n=1 Tax=Cornus florida TaxID=4283 RepID=UPI00289F6760|nr:uncharacterized protein LOC132268320 isoform X2 [Cornus florida]XP_059625155.1 uncharacterized protein LOC132268320 isoform X2 [Cornus florida]
MENHTACGECVNMKVDRGSTSALVSRLPLGQSNVFDNGSSRDNSDDSMFDIENPKRSELSIQHPRSNVHQENDSHGLLIEQPFKPILYLEKDVPNLDHEEYPFPAKGLSMT